uniref:Uncharacterized protein n=1 Tax=Trichobilharzia regenti TaxID=157069 RepID=A0AA85K1H3_TRIRE|nr:unnamed protein product [Trichobilharzia regenti]
MMFEKDKSVEEKNNSTSNSNNNNNIDPLSIQPIIPKCYCYISSHGNRRFNYNLCKYHQDFSSSCRHHHNHNHRQQYSLQHNSHLHLHAHCHHICKHNSLHKYRLPSPCHTANRDIIVTSASTSMTKPTSTAISITNKDKNITTTNEDISTQNQTLV